MWRGWCDEDVVANTVLVAAIAVFGNCVCYYWYFVLVV